MRSTTRVDLLLNKQYQELLNQNQGTLTQGMETQFVQKTKSDCTLTFQNLRQALPNLTVLRVINYLAGIEIRRALILQLFLSCRSFEFSSNLFFNFVHENPSSFFCCDIYFICLLPILSVHFR